MASLTQGDPGPLSHALPQGLGSADKLGPTDFALGKPEITVKGSLDTEWSNEGSTSLARCSSAIAVRNVYEDVRKHSSCTGAVGCKVMCLYGKLCVICIVLLMSRRATLRGHTYLPNDCEKSCAHCRRKFQQAWNPQSQTEIARTGSKGSGDKSKYDQINPTISIVLPFTANLTHRSTFCRFNSQSLGCTEHEFLRISWCLDTFGGGKHLATSSGNTKRRATDHSDTALECCLRRIK